MSKENDIFVIDKLDDPSTDQTMFSSLTKCRPIENYKDIENALSNPPEWIERVIPLKKRCGYVVKNSIVECHSNEDNFLLPSRFDSRSVPKTLVCHDYKGGYLSDSYIPLEGSEDKPFTTEGYPFYNWAQIDYFVYFSHYFITIPPLSWINAGHKNGVKVLGTIITENNDGIKLCNEEIFCNRDSMREFAYNIAEITKLFGFDGWLLNIENEVKNVHILKEFVRILTDRVHKLNSEHVILWYDSVTKDGQLKWQNELNDLNRCFFDNCDGIFLNYGWDEGKLINTTEAAGCRRFDVFVGIDVFGRNMFGGGQFNTFKAAEMISRYNLSIAIFAPGWTHETMNKDPKQTFFNRFLDRDDALWLSLWPYLYTHPINDFFETDFHVGLDQSFYNMFQQKHQLSKILYPGDMKIIPNDENILTLYNSCECMKRGYFESKNVCVVSKHHLRKINNIVHNMFVCDIKLRNKVGVYCLTKAINNLENTELSITLWTQLYSGSIRKVKCMGRPKLELVENTSTIELNPIKPEDFNRSQAFNVVKRHSQILNSAKHFELVSLSLYEFSTTPCDLLQIGVSLQDVDSVMLLGFGVIEL